MRFKILYSLIRVGGNDASAAGQGRRRQFRGPERGRFFRLRLDDNNNEFLVRDGLTEEEALALVREFEARGHRQAYWVKNESRAAGSVKSTAS